MKKTLPVTDRQYDWFMARNRRVKSLVKTLDQVIALVDRVEADLKKYHTWAGTEAPFPKEGGRE